MILDVMQSSQRNTSDSQSQLVSVIIPAKDEANTIGSIITKIKQSLSKYNFEIITVDDGSTDNTAEIARATESIVISHKHNLGKGAAMKTGVGKSKGNIIVFIDSDGAHHPKDIPGIIAPIIQNKADFVIGSRALRGSNLSGSPLARRLSNNLASFIISVIISFFPAPTTGIAKQQMREYHLISGRLKRITDCTSGFRAITRDAWQRLNLVSDEFQIETEMLYEAARNKLTMAEVPISCNWDSRFSRLSIVQDGLRTLKLLLKKLLQKNR